MEEVQENYNTLDTILKDEKTFLEVVNAVFKSVDKDGSGGLDITEIREFIDTVCQEMGVKSGPGKQNVQDIFDDIDEDKSKTISQEELAKFLRILFEEQKKLLAKQLQE